MKKVICLIAVCVMLCVCMVPAFAANTYTYQFEGFSFSSDIYFEEYYKNCTEADYFNGFDECYFWEFNPSELGTMIFEAQAEEDEGFIEQPGELEILEFYEYTIYDSSTDTEIVYDDPDDFDIVMDWYKSEMFDESETKEVTIDGFPAVIADMSVEVDGEYHGYCEIITYDDSYFYSFTITAFDEDALAELVDDLLDADLNDPMSESDSNLAGSAAPVGAEDDSEDKSADDKDEGKNSAEDETEAAEDDAAATANTANEEPVSMNNTILIIVIGVVMIAALICVTVVLLKKKK